MVFRVVHALTFRWQLQITKPFSWWWLIVHLVWSNSAFVIGAWIRLLYVQFILKSKPYSVLLKLLSSWQSGNFHVKISWYKDFDRLLLVLSSLYLLCFQGLGGVFAAVAEIVTISLGGTVVSSAFWYFMLAVLVIALSLIAYLFLYKLVSSRYGLSCIYGSDVALCFELGERILI